MGSTFHPNVEIDHRAKLYLVRFGASVEAISFDDVRDLTNALAGYLGRPAMGTSAACTGSLDDYARYRALMVMAASHSTSHETWFHPRTAPAAKAALECARITKQRVRLYYGNQANGLDSLHTDNASGYVGRRGEVLQFPTLCPSREHSLGLRIHDNAVVRIELLDSFVDLWRHPNYRLPRLDYVPLLDGRARLVIDGKRELDFANDSDMNSFMRLVGGEPFVPSLASNH